MLQHAEAMLANIPPPSSTVLKEEDASLRKAR